MESCWDGRRIIGEIPVFEDGSATFKIPANTPVVVQPLDEEGSAVQLMRSWFVGMPGETESCIGCHETQNDISPVKQTEAQRSAPTPISPFYGPERSFSFEGEIQPILDRYCVGCHDGSDQIVRTLPIPPLGRRTLDGIMPCTLYPPSRTGIGYSCFSRWNITHRHRN